MPDVLSKLRTMARAQKKYWLYWLMPIIAMTLLIGTLVLLTQGADVVPYIYPTV